MVAILLDCDGHHGHRGTSVTQRSRIPRTVTAIEVITANSVSSVPYNLDRDGHVGHHGKTLFRRVKYVLDRGGPRGHRGKLGHLSRTTWIATPRFHRDNQHFRRVFQKLQEEARGKFQVAKFCEEVELFRVGYSCSHAHVGPACRSLKCGKTHTDYESFEPVDGGTRSSERCLSEE